MKIKLKNKNKKQGNLIVVYHQPNKLESAKTIPNPSFLEHLHTIGVLMIIKLIFFFRIVKDSNQNIMSTGVFQFGVLSNKKNLKFKNM